ncbi:MAG: NADH-quinone oxidoreductase subunit N [Verrucomicrobia bacterium]|nr:NADH-quinone oxidoreductase subunit N [Verrucomicrobiota bacterium]
MNDLVLMGLEGAVLVTGLAVLLLDLWITPDQRRLLGFGAIATLGVIFCASFAYLPDGTQYAFGGMYALDEFALYFKRFFLIAGMFVLLLSVGTSHAEEGGQGEYLSLSLFALAGMMFCASAANLALLFVSLELVTVTFYVLVGFQRRRLASLEAAIKYLIIGALSSAFLVYGIALIYGATGTLDFRQLASLPAAVMESRILWLGALFLFVGLGFKMAAVPFQIWAPDVYQGAPPSTTAFLAVGSKAAGFVLLLRVLHQTLPVLETRWLHLLMGVAGLSIAYGVLCAIPQRSLKRLLGYSSIANAGYLLIGVATLSAAGATAALYYLAGYLYTVLAAFIVIAVVLQHTGRDDFDSLAGLHQRSPLLAAGLTFAMVSLAGIPPLAGFFGKFLVLKAALAAGAEHPGFYWLLGIAVVGVVISLYYYFGVVRAVYWGTPGEQPAGPIRVEWPLQVALYLAMVAILWLGVMPNQITNLAELAVKSLGLR